MQREVWLQIDNYTQRIQTCIDTRTPFHPSVHASSYACVHPSIQADKHPCMHHAIRLCRHLSRHPVTDLYIRSLYTCGGRFKWQVLTIYLSVPSLPFPRSRPSPPSHPIPIHAHSNTDPPLPRAPTTHTHTDVVVL